MARFASILFIDPDAAAAERAEPECFGDLHLDQIVDSVVGANADELKRFFYLPLHDVGAVSYRHDVFRDLARPEIRNAVEAFVTGMNTMRKRMDRAAHLFHRLQQQGWFVYGVQAFCDTVTALRADLAKLELSARGLIDFAAFVDAYVDSDRFARLSAETRSVQADLAQVRYCVHIEGPKVHVDTYEDQADYSVDVAATFERFASQTERDYHVQMKDFADMNHVEEQVLQYVAKLYPQQFGRLQTFCTQHRRYMDPTIARFDREVAFYLAYVRFMDRVTDSGLGFCYPSIAADPGQFGADGAFDAALAIKAFRHDIAVVCNDFHLSGAERIFVITGPNQGGKTTLARTIGQIAYLGALGCPVPARRATLPLPDEIYTHFERQETLATLHGKLDNELQRIHDILSTATAGSVIVMNESFSSTTVDDSVLIGTEVLQRIIDIGCVAVYVTFLDELASLDPVCVSMVGEVAPHDPTERTFRFTRRRADGMAYASALAAKYGLSHDDLLERITR
jgi:DNA mismatch repair protein MutS